jgi:hypothetical protein
MWQLRKVHAHEARARPEERASQWEKSLTVIRRNNNDVDEGVIAFSVWLQSSGEIDSSTAPICLGEFLPHHLVLLHDHMIQKDVSVEISNGIPHCKECNSNDCAHVGFAICAEQMYRRSVLE